MITVEDRHNSRDGYAKCDNCINLAEKILEVGDNTITLCDECLKKLNRSIFEKLN